MDRRAFLRIGAAGAAGAIGSMRRVDASPAQTPSRGGEPARTEGDVPYGQSRLGLSDDDRDGTLLVPKAYKDGTPMPLVMMLHGFAGTAARGTFGLAEEFGAIVIAPESRGLTWGQSAPGFDADVRYLGAAYRHVTDILDVDRTRVALGGISDGAGYALGMGLAYGDVFNHLMVFSGGLMTPFRKQGKPRIFIAHGIRDTQMPIDRTARRFVPQLKSEGYDVTYYEYDGGHGPPASAFRAAFEWFVPADRRPK